MCGTTVGRGLSVRLGDGPSSARWLTVRAATVYGSVAGSAGKGNHVYDLTALYVGGGLTITGGAGTDSVHLDDVAGPHARDGRPPPNNLRARRLTCE